MAREIIDGTGEKNKENEGTGEFTFNDFLEMDQNVQKKYFDNQEKEIKKLENKNALKIFGIFILVIILFALANFSISLYEKNSELMIKNNEVIKELNEFKRQYEEATSETDDLSVILKANHELYDEDNFLPYVNEEIQRKQLEISINNQANNQN